MDKEKIRTYLRIAIISVLSMIVGCVITILIKDDTTSVSKPVKVNTKLKGDYSEFEPLFEAYDSIMNEYYEEVDVEKMVDGALNGLLDSLGDKHTMYFNKENKKEFDTELSGTYYGIGAQIQLTENEEVKIIKIFNDSPAEKSGLKVGDVFLNIDGTSTKGMSATEVANKLKSSDVKTAKIVVRRDDEKLTFKVKKENVTMFSVSSEMLDDNIGYISVSIFGEKTYSQFKDALEKLEKDDMKSLIIDLRGNTGGYLYTVTNMLELFIDKGQVLYKMQTNTGVQEYKSHSNSNRDYKVVLLIDEQSASASEIMAAAMKEQYSAVLVGKTTYGKGTVQVTKNLSNGAMIKYTIEKWLTPSGKNIDSEGIAPDHEVNITAEYTNDPVKENDDQLKKAIEVINEE